MTIEKIYNAKDKFNGWNLNVYYPFEPFWELIKAVINGDEYDEEELAVLTAGEIVREFKGWLFMLPSTKEVFENEGKRSIKFVYDEYFPSIGEFAGTFEKEEIFEIPKSWEEFDSMDGHYPEVIQRFLDEECRPWKDV